MAKPKNALPFDNRGGVVRIQLRLYKSEAYLALSLHARCLMPLLQCHWRNDKSVDFGVREAAEKLSCNPRTAMRAFKELQEKGFIKMADDYYFDTFGVKGGSRPRAWRLTWLPFNGKAPSNDWEKQNAGALSATQN
ncbi:MAG: hypothetical protein WBJ75_12590 [Pseudohongiellaceae bacterium]